MEQVPAKKQNLQFVTQVYKGVLMLVNEVEEIGKMEVKNDDIWVCSYPRSGTTLTQELVYLIQTLDFDTANSVNLDKRFPIIDVKDERFPYYKGLKMFNDMKSPRFIKCHLHEYMLPKSLKEGKGRMIYIARNPKDVVTSYYKLQLWFDMADDFAAFVDSFIAGTDVQALHCIGRDKRDRSISTFDTSDGPQNRAASFYCPWPTHVLQFWERRNDPNVLFLKYEDVVKDLPATVRMIADFLKRTLTDDDVTRICEHCHVDSMRKNDNVNLSYLRNFKNINDSAGGEFINKGKPGVWSDVLTPDMSSRIDKMLRELDGTGLSFDHC